MAKSCTRLTSGIESSGSGTTVNTASVSPGANSAIVVAVVGFNGANMAISGGGLSWTTKINGFQYATDHRIWVFVAYGSPSAGVLTLTYDDGTFLAWSVDNITGTVSSTPTNANTATGSGTSTTPAATLGAFADAANGTWAYYVAQESTTCAPGTGFAQVAERESTSLFDFTDATQFRDSNDTSVDATVGASAAWGMVTLEIVESAAGGTVNTQTLSDTLEIADAGLPSKTSGRLGADTLTITDQGLDYVFYSRLGSDSVTVTDGPMEFFSVYGISAISELEVSDGFVAWLRRQRLLEDNILVTDELISTVIGYLIFTSILTSNVIVTDQALRTAYFYRLAESNVLTTDQILRALLVARDLLDGIEVTDSVLTAAQRFILLTDTISLEDALTALYVPPVGPATDNPIIRIGFDQPAVTLGGYSVN
jgi:hypothetical protein